MKFEKFVKMVGCKGIVIDAGEDGKFLSWNNVMLKIPQGVNVVGMECTTPSSWIKEIIDDAAEVDGLCIASLIRAELATPDASTSDIMRIFADEYGDEIAVNNKVFGIIERCDDCYIDAFEDDDTDETVTIAMCMYEGYGDDRELEGIIINPDYVKYIKDKEYKED